MGGQHGHPTPPVFRVEMAVGGVKSIPGAGWPVDWAGPRWPHQHLGSGLESPVPLPNTSPASAYLQAKGPGGVKRGGF